MDLSPRTLAALNVLRYMQLDAQDAAEIASCLCDKFDLEPGDIFDFDGDDDYDDDEEEYDW